MAKKRKPTKPAAVKQKSQTKPTASAAQPGVRQLGLTAALLFCSGACALAYQVCWFRQFRYFFGASTTASAAVMAVFMAGLGWGSLVLGKRADKRPRPLLFYGQLELLIGVFAVLSGLFMVFSKWAYIALGGIEALGGVGAGLVRLGLSFVVIGAPTFLMGGTLPAAANAVTDNADSSRHRLGLLYGVNTLGAFAGGYLATFYLHEYLGVQTTLWLAAGLNIVVAAAAVILGRSKLFPPLPVDEDLPESRPETETIEPSPQAKPVALVTNQKALPPKKFILLCAFMVGFIFLLQEIVWYRMMAPILGGSTYTISLILCVALLGIGAGGALYTFWRQSKTPTLGDFAITCSLEAVFMALPLALGDRMAVWASTLNNGTDSFGGLIVNWFILLGIAVFPASLISGFQFPLLIALMGKGRKNVGRELGQAYIFNATGAILGSIAGGFGLMRLLSAPGTWRLSVVILGVLTALALYLAFSRERLRVRPAVASALLLLAIIFTFQTGPTGAWRHSGIGAGRSELETADDPIAVGRWLNANRRYISWEQDGIESNVAISEAEGIKFIVNGRTDGNTVSDAHTQVMGGLIGNMLHPAPKKVLVIGLGTGSTAGWIAADPRVERVDAVELEPAVLHVADVSAAVNHDVMHHPKVRHILGDAREFLLTTRESYDIIFSEPSNPYRAGIASLYTREYYETAFNKLNDGGIFLQFLQGYSVDETTVQRVYSTLAAVFPAVETWIPGGADMIMAAQKTPAPYDVSNMRARLSTEPFRSALFATWRVDNLEGFFSRYLANNQYTRRRAVFSGDTLNTDDKTYIEFALARTVGQNLFNPYDCFVELRDSERRPRLVNGEVNWSLAEEYRVNLLPQGFPNHLIYWGEPDDSGAFHRVKALYEHRQADRLSPEYPQLLQTAIQSWAQQSNAPSKPDEWLLIAEWAALNAHENTPTFAQNLGQYNPVDAQIIMAMFHARRGDLETAATQLIEAYQGFQKFAWPNRPLVMSSFALAQMIASADKDLGEAIFRTLQQPFAVEAMKAQREAALYKLSMVLDFDRLCLEVFPSYEPHPLLDLGFLEARVRCYEANNHEALPRAQKELETYRKNLPRHQARNEKN